MAGPKKSYNVRDVIREARLTLPSIEFDFGEGQVFTIDPPELWSDEISHLGADGKADEMIDALFDDAPAFREACKVAGVGVLTTFNLVMKEHTGAEPGESSPSSNS
jgi:hypothetical protein